MTSKEAQVRGPIAEQAAEWFVADDSGPLEARESAALAEWLKGSPLHVEEFLRVSVLARDLREAGSGPEHTLEALLDLARAEDDAALKPFWPRALATVREGSPRGWRIAAATVATLAVVIVGWVGLRNLGSVAPVPAPTVTAALHFETRHGEQQTHHLADNSILHLNTDSAVTITYSKTARLAVLTAGEADFEIAHEPARAFRVFAGPAEVVDLGTSFDVRLESRSTVVTVVEGRVGVGLAPKSENGGATPMQGAQLGLVQLGPNQQVTVSGETGPGELMTVDAQRTTAWLHRQIAFQNEPLERVAAEFNRYAQKPIEIATPSLRNLPISGVFATGNTEAFIAFLRTLPGVRVEVTPTRVRVSQN